MSGSVVEAVSATHAWLQANRGWAAPEPAAVARWVTAGECPCPDGCLVAPARTCPHGLVSWWLVLRCLDRADRPDPLPPERLVPLPARLDPARRDYVAVLDAHQRAVLGGQPGYIDPTTRLFVLTARSLWDRGNCCGQGCRHCPYTGRPGVPRA